METLTPGTLGALIRDGGRGAPVSPAHFEEELKEKNSAHELLDDAQNELILADDDEPVR